MLLEKDKCCLLLIDVQEKLTPLIYKKEELLKHCEWLLQVAQTLNVPCLLSEQYPKGLGPTLASLKSFITAENCFEKVDFSCWREPDFKQAFQMLNKKQVVLIGIETHVCVLQTAFDLIKADYEVFVVVEGVSSRSLDNKRYALKRMKQAGIQLITAEMVFFEWVGKAGTPEFKQLSKKFLQ